MVFEQNARRVLARLLHCLPASESISTVRQGYLDGEPPLVRRT